MATASLPRRTTSGQPPAAPVKRLSLADAVKGGKGLPSRLVVHGQGGIGKTSFAAQAPKPFFLLSRGETGLHTLIDAGQLPEVPNLEVEDWDNALSIIDELTTGGHDYKTLALDVLDGFEKMCNEAVCRTSFNNDWGAKGFANYAAGNRFVASGPWRELLNSLDRLREQKRMAVILLAHTGQGNFKNPTGADFDRFAPSMYKDVWQLTFGWADIVLFGYPEVIASKERGESKAKGISGERVFRTEWDAAFDAKNRHGLPPEIPMGRSGAEAWNNFIEALKAGKARKEGE